MFRRRDLLLGAAATAVLGTAPASALQFNRNMSRFPGTVRRAVGTKNDFPDSTLPSDGTNNTFNSRSYHWTGTEIQNPSVVYVGYATSNEGEANFLNPVTYHTAIELPDGQITQFLKAGSIDHVVNPGDTFNESDQLSGFVIPKGGYWLRTWGTVPANGYFYATDYYPDPTFGDVCENGVNLPDKSLSGAIQNEAYFLPGPVCVVGSVARNQRSFALVGDSISVGYGGYISPLSGGALGVGWGGGIGYMAGCMDGRYNYVHFGRGGYTASSATTTMTLRRIFMRQADLTDMWCELGINDMAVYDVPAQELAGYISEIFHPTVKGQKKLPNIKRYYQSTITPATINNNTQPFPDLVDGKRDTFNNDYVRNGALPYMTNFVEAAAPIESDDLWVRDSYTADGVHPSQSGGNVMVSYVRLRWPF
jgi:hypothetical protein